MKVRRRKGSKSYFVDLRVNGKRIRVSLDTTDRRLAFVKAKIEAAKFAEQVPTQPKTLAAFEIEYLKYAGGRKEQSSVNADRYALMRFAKFVQPGVIIDEITVRQADLFIAQLCDEVKPITASFYLRALKTIFGTALRWQYVQQNVFAQVKRVRFELPPARILTITEIRAFNKKMREMYPHLAPLIEFYLMTGARRGEAIRLQWDQVDFAKRQIVLKQTKGKRVRYIPMVKKVYRILHARRELPQPFIFRGEQFKQDYITRRVSEVLKECKIKDATLHDLRKSFASYLADSGMPDFFISTLLGHQDRETTDRHYIARFDSMIRRYMTKFEKKVFG